MISFLRAIFSSLSCELKEVFISSKLLFLVYIWEYFTGDELKKMAGRKIAPNAGANATKFFTLATKS